MMGIRRDLKQPLRPWMFLQDLELEIVRIPDQMDPR